MVIVVVVVVMVVVAVVAVLVVVVVMAFVFGGLIFWVRQLWDPWPIALVIRPSAIDEWTHR